MGAGSAVKHVCTTGLSARHAQASAAEVVTMDKIYFFMLGFSQWIRRRLSNVVVLDAIGSLDLQMPAVVLNFGISGCLLQRADAFAGTHPDDAERPLFQHAWELAGTITDGQRSGGLLPTERDRGKGPFFVAIAVALILVKGE